MLNCYQNLHHMMSKRIKVEDSDQQFAEIDKVLRTYDEKRELMIKKCRDLQKLSKQAIYSLQRNDLNRANSLLSQCEGIAKPELFDLVKQDSELRYGSFASALEEYTEAILFKYYLQNPDLAVPMLKNDIPLAINEEEFLGGLMDCCGEV